MKSLTDWAGDLQVSTEQVLTALQIVATRAGVDELAAWSAKELAGYEEDDELPPYRIWRLTIVATLCHSNIGVVRDAHVGHPAIATRDRKNVTTYYCRDGVGPIENALLTKGDHEKNPPLHVEHPNLAYLINRGPMLAPGWTCTHASAEFSPMHLQTIVNKVRQTALRLCLECEKKGVDLQYGADDSTTPKERKAWIRTLKQEGTKVVIRGAWDLVAHFLKGA